MNLAPLQSFCIRCRNRFTSEPIKDGIVIHPHLCPHCATVQVHARGWGKLLATKRP